MVCREVGCGRLGEGLRENEHLTDLNLDQVLPSLPVAAIRLLLMASKRAHPQFILLQCVLLPPTQSAITLTPPSEWRGRHGGVRVGHRAQAQRIPHVLTQ